MKKSICILADIFPARSQTFVRDHAEALSDRGWEVSVIAGSSGKGFSASEKSQYIDSCGFNVKYVNDSSGNRLIRFIKAFLYILIRPRLLSVVRKCTEMSDLRAVTLAYKKVKLANKFAPSIFHIHFGNQAAALDHFKMNGKVVVTWHGSDANVYPTLRGPDLYRELLSSPYYHTVNSLFLESKLLKLGADKRRLSVIRMGVDLNKFELKEYKDEKVNILKVLCVGRLEKVKGHIYLIKAIEKLIAKKVGCELHLVGDGRERGAIESYLAMKHLTENVQLHGAQDSKYISDLMKGCDVFAMTGIVSDDGAVEAQGIVYAEAQATGMPVILSNAGGAPETIIDSKSGIACEPKNVDSIVQALNHYVENPSDIRTHGLLGRDFVKSNFCYKETVIGYLNLYEKILAC